MADIKREAKADDDVTLPDELMRRAQAYSAMAIAHSTVTFEQRRAFDTSAVRHLNNFVKACTLDACARAAVTVTPELAASGLRVADIAAGRGQDQAKLMYAARDAGTTIAEYYALDLSAEDTVSAQLMSVKYLQPHAKVLSIVRGDMGAAFNGVPDAGIDIVTCQLALHYLFDAEAHLRTFFQEAARVLTRHGVLVVSYADGRSIVRRARNAIGRVKDMKDTADVTVQARYYGFTIPTQHLRRAIPSPYGLRYTFTLPGSVDAIPEYLAHEGCIAKHACQSGLHAGTSLCFDEAALRFVGVPRYRDVSEKMGGGWYDDEDALDTANIYRINVFSKSTAALQAWDACSVGTDGDLRNRFHGRRS